MIDKNINPIHPVLIVDDEVQALQSCELMLRTSGIENIICCQDSRKVIEYLKKQDIGVLLLDLFMPHLSGEKLLEIVSQEYPYIPTIVITALNEIEKAVNCVKLGAYDYIVKPVEKSRMINSVKRAIEIRELRHDYNMLTAQLFSNKIKHPEAFSEIITNHSKMRSIFQYIETIAGTPKPIMITGETGVGKELIAKTIHILSGRKGEFVAVNIAGLDDNMFSDTLFGHIKGAFTGADKTRNGLVEKAAHGTLFLDEIGDLGLASQVKLLRLLQEREYIPLGADAAKLTDAFIITSTNQDLQHLQESGKFRKDLYFRLITHHIHIPPLRERISDIPLLVDYFIDKAAKLFNKYKPTVPREIYDLLSTYHFPGNIRELESMIYDSVSIHKAGKLSLKVIKDHIKKSQEKGISSEMKAINHESLFLDYDILPTLKEATSLLVNEALKRSKGNQTIAAQLLGITQSALNKRLKRVKKQ